MKNNFLFPGRLAGAVRRPVLLTGLLWLLAIGSSWAMNPFSKIVLAPRQETYVPLTGGTAVPLVQTNDTVSAGLPIGFDFKFDGQSYTTVYASSNGFLSFNSAVTSDRVNDLSSPNYDSSPLLAALWDDLDGTGGTASYRTTGTTPNRVFTFEWRNWKWGTTATGANISFQTRLYEGSGRIEYAYTGVGGPPPAVTGDGAAIGFSNGDFFASVDGTGPNPTLDLAIAHNDLTNPPANGQVYAFVPPTPPANDECAGAVQLTVAPGNNRCANAYNSTNHGATYSGASVPTTCGGTTDTWYRFVAPASGNVRLLVTGVSADLELYSGSCSSLTSVDCNGNGNSNGNQVSGLAPGAMHYLRVSVGSNFEAYPYTVCVSSLDAAPAVTNDECASAILVAAGNSCQEIAGNLNGATVSTGAPDPSCVPWFGVPVTDVWYRTVVPASGTVYARTSSGSAIGGLSGVGVSMYSGSCPSLTELGCNESNGAGQFGRVLLTGRTPGEVLYIRVWLRDGYSGGTFGLCVTDYSATDLVVNTLNTSIDSNSGDYRNITITGTGSAMLSNNITVTNALVVQNGGALNTDTYAVTGPGTFTLQAGGTLEFRDAAGLSASGATGAVRVSGTRTFSNDASYTYRVGPNYVTGTGLPTTVRNLYVNTDQDFNFDAGTAPGPGSLTLTNPLSVRQRLHLRRNLNTSSATPLTLLSTPTQGTALIYNDTDGNPFGIGGTAVVSGPARVQRAIDPTRNSGPGYRHYSSPVAGATVASLATNGFAPVVNPAFNISTAPNAITPFPNIQGYDEQRVATSPATTLTNFDKGWFSPTATSNGLETGHGYTVNIGAGSVVQLEGQPNSGSINVNLTRGAGPDAGWAFLGNPYPSPLDWSLLTKPSNVGSAMYVYESNSQYAGIFRSYVNGIGNPIIPSGQGFFARVNTPTTVPVTFTFEDAARVTEFEGNGTTFRRSAGDARPLVQLSLRSAAGSLADITTVYVEAGATAALDAAFDASKLPNPGTANLFTLAGSNERLAINGLAPAPGVARTVELGLALPQAGTYILTADALRNLTAGGISAVALLDRRTGQQTLLSMGTSYSFALTATETTSLSRFALLFNPSAAPLATATQALASQISLYPNPAHGRFSLSLPALPGTAAVRLTLRNALGQVVLPPRSLPLTATGAMAEFDANALAAGVYLLQISGEGIPQITKRVVLE